MAHSILFFFKWKKSLQCDELRFVSVHTARGGFHCRLFFSISATTGFFFLLPTWRNYPLDHLLPFARFAPRCAFHFCAVGVRSFVLPFPIGRGSQTSSEERPSDTARARVPFLGETKTRRETPGNPRWNPVNKFVLKKLGKLRFFHPPPPLLTTSLKSVCHFDLFNRNQIVFYLSKKYSLRSGS